MQLTFVGAAEAVTGSCSLLVDDRIGVRFLVDCGAHAERGPGFADGAPRLPFDARDLEAERERRRDRAMPRLRA